jgi:hypothetical protein
MTLVWVVLVAVRVLFRSQYRELMGFRVKVSKEATTSRLALKV